MSPIETLAQLDQRWPGFIEMMKSLSGVSDEKINFSHLVEMNERICGDQEGLEMLLHSLFQLSRSGDKADMDWLIENGFVNQGLLDDVARVQDLRLARISGDLEEKDILLIDEEIEKVLNRIESRGERAQKSVSSGLCRLSEIIL